MPTLTQIAICRDCGSEFESQLKRGAWTVRCPECADLAQRKPTVVTDRHLLYGPVVCQIDSLPGEWQKFEVRKGLHESYVIDRAGSSFGASWNGRVVIRADRPWEIGSVVVFEEIEALHKVVSVAYTREWTNDDGEERERRTMMGVPPALADDVEAIAAHVRKTVALHWPDATVANIEIEGETLECHRYVRLSPLTRELRNEWVWGSEYNTHDYEEDASKRTLLKEVYGDEIEEEERPLRKNGMPRLVWVTAPYKTTLKGYGRQYAYALKGSPLWAQRVSGGYRSGRAGTSAILALVDDEHTLESVLEFNQ
jgi:hypothetical protein